MVHGKQEEQILEWGLNWEKVFLSKLLIQDILLWITETEHMELIFQEKILIIGLLASARHSHRYSSSLLRHGAAGAAGGGRNFPAAGSASGAARHPQRAADAGQHAAGGDPPGGLHPFFIFCLPRQRLDKPGGGDPRRASTSQLKITTDHPIFCDSAPRGV